MVEAVSQAEAVATPRQEPRLPVILTILTVMLLMAMLPERIRLVPRWATAIVAGLEVLVLAACAFSRGRRSWLLIERWVTVAFVSFAGAVLLTDIQRLFVLMLHTTASSGEGLTLLSTSVAVWLVNVMIFTLGYWQLDRGGPEGRARDLTVRPDWRFPQDDLDELFPDGWSPQFGDYLFLAFSTATAFSTTDVLPISRRAKMLMMAESLISLVNIAFVGARAINVLGG
jgi:hypothetical protein